MMPGVAFEEIHEAIYEAYDDNSLARTLKFHMDFDFRRKIPQNLEYEHQVFRLVEWADMNGRDVELVRATARDRPGHAKMQAIYKKYGMATPVLVQEAGRPVPAAPTDAADVAGMERFVRPHLGTVNFGLWLERMTRVGDQVCRITSNGHALGTGFLVGPETVLTNHHVLEQVWDNDTLAAGVACEFDYKVLQDGSRGGTPIGLHPTDWKIDSSPMTQAEKERQPDRADATDDELDYALVRLAEAVGSKPVGDKSGAGAPARGWVRIPDEGPEFKPRMAVIIAQHPDGRPLEMALDTQAIDRDSGLWVRSNENRVRYATNTQGGSSGSPCFDFTNWNLIALHHYGDPAYGHPRYNQGIPIGKIRDRIKRNFPDALGGDPG